MMTNIYREISSAIGLELSEEEVKKSCESLSGKGCWVFEYVAHIPEGVTVEFNSLHEMGEHLLGKSSILNAFTTNAIAIVNNNIAEFKIYRKDGSETVEFKKDQQLSSNEPFGDSTYIWKLEWLSA